MCPGADSFAARVKTEKLALDPPARFGRPDVV